MSDRAIEIIRWIIFASAALSLLQGTLLFRPFKHRFLDPWVAMIEKAGGRAPIGVRNERFMRFWALLMSALFLGIWWHLGTTAGAELLRRG